MGFLTFLHIIFNDEQRQLTPEKTMIQIENPRIGLVILRTTAGIGLLAHSIYLKVFIFTMSGTTAFFQSLGLPGILAWITLAVEIVAGLCLIFGIKVRYAASAAIVVMLGALWAHSGNGWLFSNTGGGWEYPAFWTAALVSIVFLEDVSR